jgi:hypothetical protein
MHTLDGILDQIPEELENLSFNEVSSGTLHSYSFDPETSILYMAFKKGSVYKYTGVDESVIEDFNEAPSKGSFFNKFIARAYEYKRVI